ncbi:MAG: redox-sensing transcriptional repressor Rex [Planctomycetota bacterium]|jgi:redox-sensing transcriptional repressor|nr:redox-sensing transcriptional repressor Rex [Planctomycetota bacterium]
MRVGNLPGIRRLPLYLDALRHFMRDGVDTISTSALAARTGFVVSVVRKDLEMTGAYGKTGVGFDARELALTIESFLGWDNPNDAFLAGVGSLGSAIINHDEFRSHGLNIVAAFDVDPGRIGWRVHGIEVLPIAKLVDLATRMHITMGVITVPGPQAQAVANLFVEGGINRIWSFATPILDVPDHVTVKREDLSAGLAELLVRSAARRSGPKQF